MFPPKIKEHCLSSLTMFTPDLLLPTWHSHLIYIVTCPTFTLVLLSPAQISHLICCDLPSIHTWFVLTCPILTPAIVLPARHSQLICCHLPKFYTWFVVTWFVVTYPAFTPDLLWLAWHSHMISHLICCDYAWHSHLLCCHLSDIHTWYVVTCLTFTHNMLSPARHLHLISWALADYNDIFYMLPMGEAFSRRFVRPSGTLSSKKL